MESYSKGWGERLKARRTELGLSLRDLAAQTGLSATFLSTLERGVANPTLNSLRKVSNALGLPLLRLTGENSRSNPVVHHDQRRRLVLRPGQVEYEILTPSLTRKMVLIQVQATADQGNLVAQPLAEPTEECLVLLSGRVAICLAGHVYELAAGDSIYFEGHELESIHVLGDQEAVYISAITPPVF
jgi:transcriptional regulator with XRE-family HTH domain